MGILGIGGHILAGFEVNLATSSNKMTHSSFITGKEMYCGDERPQNIGLGLESMPFFHVLY